MSVADDIYDGTVRNQIGLRRYIDGQVLLLLALFEKYDRRLARLLRKHHRTGMTLPSKEYRDMLQAVKELREELLVKAGGTIHKSLEDLVPAEHDKEWALLLLLLGLKGKRPDPTPLRRILRLPFSSGTASAATLDQWLKDLQAADFKRIRDTLTWAIDNEYSTNDVVAAAVGTKAENFRDGTAAVSRHNVRALVVTVVAHVSTWTRLGLWARISQVTAAMWSAILDSSTTDICLSRHGKIILLNGGQPPEGAILLQPQSARTPAHVGCRSMIVAVYRGQMPDRVSATEWLRRQSKATQDDILGETKAEMFRNGKLTVDKLTDMSGRSFTLTELTQGLAT